MIGRRAIRMAAGTLLAGAGLWLAAGGARPEARAGAAPVRDGAVSFFALGDTGTLRPLHRGQRNVARALERLDRGRPADGLLLLGDNFYPRGLERGDADRRLLRNVVEPYCGFVRLTRSWRGERPGCLASAAPGPSRPIWSVLGNHDHRLEESAALQREWVPERLANWTMPGAEVGVYELPGGVSLVLYDSTVLMQQAERLPLLTRALRSTRGPWRILAGHHPLRLDWNGPGVRGSAERLRHAITESGVPVQLVLSGHEHNLQVIDLEEPGLGLQVIAGSGSRHRAVRGDVAGRLTADDALGFARVDLLDAPEPRLAVTLYELASWPLPGSWLRPWPVPARELAVFEIDLAGRFRRGRSGPFVEAATPRAPAPGRRAEWATPAAGHGPGSDPRRG